MSQNTPGHKQCVPGHDVLVRGQRHTALLSFIIQDGESKEPEEQKADEGELQA